MAKVTDMTVGSPTKHLLVFALPLIITNFGQQLYMVVDAAIVGRGVGVDALASVGATDWSYWLILWSVMGLTQGFSTFVSRYFGEKNYRGLNKTIAMSTVLCVFIAVIFTAVGILAARPLLELLKTPDNIIDGATVYIVTMIAGTPIVTAYNMASSILRALGDGKTPLVAMVIAAILNIGLDVLFIFAFKWGIFGAAIASVTAQLVAFLFCFLKVRAIECVHPDRSDWKLDFKLMWSLLAFGLPISFEHVVIALGGIILQSSVNLQGSAFIAAYTATNKVYGLLESSAISLGHACSTFLAQNYGAGKYERVKKGMRSTLIITVASAAVVMLLTLPTREYILRLFIDLNEAGASEAIDIGVYYLTIVASLLVILYLLHIYRNALQAIGISMWSFASGAGECAVRIVMSKIVMMHIGRNALFFAEPTAWLVGLIIVFLPYLYYQKKLLNKNETGT